MGTSFAKLHAVLPHPAGCLCSRLLLVPPWNLFSLHPQTRTAASLLM